MIHNENHHPDCCIFAVDEQGVETILEVSFSTIRFNGRRLLDEAAEDAENRKKKMIWVVRAIVSVLLWASGMKKFFLRIAGKVRSQNQS